MLFPLIMIDSRVQIWAWDKSNQHDRNRFLDPIPSETVAARGVREGRRLDLSYPAKGCQRETPLAGQDDS